MARHRVEDHEAKGQTDNRRAQRIADGQRTIPASHQPPPDEPQRAAEVVLRARSPHRRRLPAIGLAQRHDHGDVVEDCDPDGDRHDQQEHDVSCANGQSYPATIR